jgi:transcriptional regulator with XRE-family HTH domain
MAMTKSGEKFRLARERAGLSQGQVAQYAETGQGYISDIELNKRWPSTWELLKKLALRYRVSADFLLDIGRNVSLEGQAASDLIDSLPPEKRGSAVELLRAVIVFAEVGVPLPSSGTTGENALPEPVPARQGGGVTKSRFAELGPQQKLNGERKDELLALLKKMVPLDVYEQLRQLVESGQLVEGDHPRTDAEIDSLLQSLSKQPIQDVLELLDNEDLGNGS